MRNRLQFIFRTPETHVKPVTSGDLFGWIEPNLTVLQSFGDDRQRYGLKIALYNLLVAVRARNRKYRR